MQITNEMVEAACRAYDAPGAGTHSEGMRAALEAVLGTAIKQPVRIQDPRVLAESLIVLGPSSDGAVERDLRHELDQQTACIEDLAAALKVFAKIADCYDPPEGDDHEIVWDRKASPELGDLRRARATLEKWGLK